MMNRMFSTPSINPTGIDERQFLKLKSDDNGNYVVSNRIKDSNIVALIPKTEEYSRQLLRVANLMAERINSFLWTHEQYDELMIYECQQIMEKMIDAVGAEYLYQNYKQFIDTNESPINDYHESKIGQPRNQPWVGIKNIPIVHKNTPRLFEDIETSFASPTENDNLYNYLKSKMMYCIDHSRATRDRYGIDIGSPEEVKANAIIPTRHLIDYCRHLKGLSPEFIAEMPHLMTLEEIQAEKRKMSTATLIKNEQESDDSPDYHVTP